MSEIKGGAEEVRAPWYSHVTYDIVPGKEVVVRRPDVLIVEGLNVLAPARPRQDGRQGLALSDFFDFSIYVDAKTSYIEEWYVDRFHKLRSTAFASRNPISTATPRSPTPRPTETAWRSGSASTNRT